MNLTESNRTRLIGQIAAMLQEPTVPAETRAAGLTLIGWLARRMPEDCSPGVLGAPRTRPRVLQAEPELRRAR
jgi:hypothetical protein